MKKFHLIIIFLFVIAFSSKVNALTLTPRSSLDNYSANNSFDYTGIVSSDQRPQENFTYQGTLNTSYLRQLYGIRAYFNTPLTANTLYRITFTTSMNNFRTGSFNYADIAVCFGNSWSGANSNCNSSYGYSSITSDTISINFQPTSNYSYFSVRIGPQTLTAYPLTTDYTFRISSFTLDTLSTPPSSPTNQDVINNDNSNSQTIQDRIHSENVMIMNQQQVIEQEILQHQRQMEQNIIDNQNENTQNVIDNLNDNLANCTYNFIDISNIEASRDATTSVQDEPSYLYINFTNAWGYVRWYIDVKPNTTYTLDFSKNKSTTYVSLIGYSNGAQVETIVNDFSGTRKTFTTGSRTNILQFTIFSQVSTTDDIGSLAITNSSSIPLPFIYYGKPVCSSKLDSIYDYISDGNVNGNTGQNFFGNFQVDDFGISAIITAPLDAINSLTSATCSPLTIPIPFTNSTISLPCMTSYYSTKVPELYQLWQIVSFGIISYYIINSIFGMIHNFREPDNDCVEVLDL